MIGINGLSAYSQTPLFTNNTYDRKAPQEANEPSGLSAEMRKLIRGLDRSRKQSQNPHAQFSDDRSRGILDLYGSSEQEEDEEKIKKPVNYNYKEVANMIRSAKTSVSAERAVLSAKRKVSEIKRKISSGGEDVEELQLALTHAKRMEMVARKKKHHLELEELVKRTQHMDENRDKAEKASGDIKSALAAAEEEKTAQKEDAVFEERMSMLDEAVTAARENNAEISDKMLEDINRMISLFGEEELKQLEETMEAFEDMEVIDPHMSKEDFEDLKRKHRASENKALLKADMDYLKDMIKHELGKTSVSPSAAVNMPSFTASYMPSPISMDISMPGAVLPESASIDIQV